jgi:hypothetical protein
LAECAVAERGRAVMGKDMWKFFFFKYYIFEDKRYVLDDPFGQTY